MTPRIAIPVPTSTDIAYNQRSWPAYATAVQRSGGEPVQIDLSSSLAQIREIAATCDGIVLPESADDAATTQAIADVATAMGTVADRSGKPGVDLVKVKAIGLDRAPYRVEYDPGNPAADASGFVKLPNVNLITEMADMREANRSYSADIQVVKQARELYSMTVDLMRNSQ